MDFDTFTIVLLHLRDDAPELDPDESASLQDAHLDHLAGLHEAGHLLAAGPLLDDHLRGLSIYRLGPDEARVLADQDPGVLAGRFSVSVIEWMVPGGAVHFTSTRFPHSTEEVRRPV
jgi:uncharacterized protein